MMDPEELKQLKRALGIRVLPDGTEVRSDGTPLRPPRRKPAARSKTNPARAEPATPVKPTKPAAAPLAGTSLGTDIRTDQPVELPDAARPQGTYILGKNGFGKSSLMLNMILADARAGTGFIVLDPHGDLVRDVAARLTRKQAERVYCLDFALDFPPGLNLFACDSDDEEAIDLMSDRVIGIFRKTWGELSWGQGIEDMLANIAYVFAKNPGYTLIEVQRFLTEEPFRERLLANCTNPTVLEFWEHGFDGTSRESTAAVMRKVRGFVRNTLLYHVFGQSKTTIDLRALMDDRAGLLIRLPVGTKGEGTAQFIGAVLIDLILQAAYSRQGMSEAERKRKVCHLYFDEYHLFATPATSNLLTGGRKFGIATTVAHQIRQTLDKENLAATKNASNFLLFQLIPEDARDMSKLFKSKGFTKVKVGERPMMELSKTPFSNYLRRGQHDLAALQVAYEVNRMVEARIEHYRSDKWYDNFDRRILLNRSEIEAAIDTWAYYNLWVDYAMLRLKEEPDSPDSKRYREIAYRYTLEAHGHQIDIIKALHLGDERVFNLILSQLRRFCKLLAHDPPLVPGKKVVPIFEARSIREELVDLDAYTIMARMRIDRAYHEYPIRLDEPPKPINQVSLQSLIAKARARGLMIARDAVTIEIAQRAVAHLPARKTAPAARLEAVAAPEVPKLQRKARIAR